MNDWVVALILFLIVLINSGAKGLRLMNRRWLTNRSIVFAFRRAFFLLHAVIKRSFYWELNGGIKDKDNIWFPIMFAL